jgi:hypothetical protein
MNTEQYKEKKFREIGQRISLEKNEVEDNDSYCKQISSPSNLSENELN